MSPIQAPSVTESYSKTAPPDTGIIAPSVLSPHLPTPQTNITRGVRPEVRRRYEPLREVHYNIVLESQWRSGLMALAITVPLGVFGLVIGAQVLQSYGFSLFVGAPFAVGMISVLVFGFPNRSPWGASLWVAFWSTILVGFAMLGFGFEGVICLFMAAPITVPLALLGGLVGYTIQARSWLNDETTSLTLAIVVFLPSLMAAESLHDPMPDEQAVRTEIIIEAPAAEVWSRVIAFPPLAEPDDWFFQTGIAYPVRAEIHGAGDRCRASPLRVFSTGTFVEPIDVWDAPKRLAFRVTEQPDPLREWSPYDIHPAHLDHYFASSKGEFLLEDLGDGRTRLVGTTWYTNRMWPATYWNLWCDYIIHRIHLRVLTHIQGLAEGRE